MLFYDGTESSDERSSTSDRCGGCVHQEPTGGYWGLCGAGGAQAMSGRCPKLLDKDGVVPGLLEFICYGSARMEICE